MLELSNYWDDFQIRVNETIECLSRKEFPKLERLTVHLTENCNFRCKYCNMKFSTRTMEEILVKKIINEYAEMGGSTIHFTGREPTVVPYIEEIFAYAKSKGLIVSANTNAYKRINTDNIDKLKTSFDTPYADEFNATIGISSFEKVVDNMRIYSKEMKEKMLSITAVLNAKTYRHMLELAKFVNENFVVYNLYYSNYKGSNPEFAFTDEQIEDMFQNHIPKVLEFFKQTGNEYSYKQLSLYKRGDFKNVDCRFEENKHIPCYIQLSEMTIDVDGNCYDCSHLYRDGVVPDEIINIKNNTLQNCFEKRKNRYTDVSNMICISEKCLNGCNKNLIGFNKAVSRGDKICS